MFQVTQAIRIAPQSGRLYRWQVTVNAAFASGSVTAALLNLGALIAFSIAQSALLQIAAGRHAGASHG
jgi:hypothetical protein